MVAPNKRPLAVACSLLFALSGAVHADEVGDLKAKLEALQQQMDAMKAQLERVQAQVAASPQAPAAASQASDATRRAFLERKEGDGITFYTRGGEVSLYG